MTDHADQDSCSACKTSWRLPIALAAVLAAILLIKGRQNDDIPREPAAPAASRSRLAEAPYRVSITIDFGDKPSLSNEVPWFEGMTVRQLMSSASLAGLGETGRGESAFLESIGGVANEGAGGRNWLYRVNGNHADRSFAVYELQPGDHVLWTFTKPQ